MNAELDKIFKHYSDKIGEIQQNPDTKMYKNRGIKQGAVGAVAQLSRGLQRGIKRN